MPFLKALVTHYGLEPKLLQLELTETAYMDDPQEMKRRLAELRDFGFTVLIDDFVRATPRSTRCANCPPMC